MILQWLTAKTVHRKNWSFQGRCIEWHYFLKRWSNRRFLSVSKSWCFYAIFPQPLPLFSASFFFFFQSAVQNRGAYYTRVNTVIHLAIHSGNPCQLSIHGSQWTGGQWYVPTGSNLYKTGIWKSWNPESKTGQINEWFMLGSMININMPPPFCLHSLQDAWWCTEPF